MNASNILVIGGSGFVGSAIVRRLAARGLSVVVPTRRRDRARHLIMLPGVDVVEAEVCDAAVLARLVGGADAVVSLVGILHGDTAAPYGARFRAAHVALPRAIAEACVAAGVRRVLHVSALGVAADAPSMYLRSKADGEAAFKEAGTALDLTIFRPSVIFGRDDRFVNMFAQMQFLAPLVPVGRPQARLQPVHVEDVAEALVGAIDNRVTFGRTYDVAGPEVFTLREVIGFAGRMVGHARPVIGLPDGLARLQAFLMELSPFELLSRDNLDSLKVDSVAASPFAPELGVTPSSMAAIVPAYLCGQSPRGRYMRLRDHAGR
jgi:NADH dehydrogenase